MSKAAVSRYVNELESRLTVRPLHRTTRRLSLTANVELNIELSDRIVDIVEEGFDLAIRIASLRTSTLVSRRLTNTRLMVCASPEYVRAHGAPETPEDLMHHKVIAYSNLASGNEWHFQGPEGPVSTRVRPWVYANNGDTCCAAGGQQDQDK